MDIKDMEFQEESKSYVRATLSEHPEIFQYTFLYEGKTYQLSEEILEDLIRLSGVPVTLRRIFQKQNPKLLEETVLSLCKYYYEDQITLMLEIPEGCPPYISHISFKSSLPLLNTEFLRTTLKMLEDYEDLVEVDSINYRTDSYLSDMTIFPVKSFEYQEKSYRLGVLLTNDELDTITGRLVAEVSGIRFYLPSKYYNLSASRYLRTSADRKEALSQMLLKILESMSEDTWFSIIPEVSMNLGHCAKINVTYEEYKQSLRLLRTIAVSSDIDEEELKSLQESLSSSFEDFEQNYPTLEEKKGIYIWRCSALSENKIVHLIQQLNNWALSRLFYPESVHQIRELIGELVMVSRIATSLAKRK